MRYESARFARRLCIDDGEDIETGVIRESLEEVSVNFTPTSYYGEIENPDTSSGQRWITHYFIGEIDTLPTELGEREISEVGFFSPSELQEIDIAFDHKAVLTQYFEEIGK